MLVVMTYNVWLCLAVVLGTGLGYFVMVGISAERRPKVQSTSHKRNYVVMPNVQQVNEPEKSEEIDTNDNEDRRLGVQLVVPSTIQDSWYLGSSLAWGEFVNLVPRACKFLRRMLDENEGSRKDNS